MWMMAARALSGSTSTAPVRRQTRGKGDAGMTFTKADERGRKKADPRKIASRPTVVSSGEAITSRLIVVQVISPCNVETTAGFLASRA